MDNAIQNNETPADIIDRLIARREAQTINDIIVGEVYKSEHKELKAASTAMLSNLLEEVESRPHEGWGDGYHASRVLDAIESELRYRANYDAWREREKNGDKEIELDGGIKVVLTKYGQGHAAHYLSKWFVRTIVLGLKISEGKTRKDAIANANKEISKRGIEKVKQIMKESDVRYWEN